MLTPRAALYIAGAVAVLGGTVWLADDFASRPHVSARDAAATFSETEPAALPDRDRGGVTAAMLPTVDAEPGNPETQLASRFESQFARVRQQLQAQQRHLRQQRADIHQLRHALQAGAASTSRAAADAGRASAEESAVREQERMVQLATDLASEAVDHDWATTAVEEIAAAVQQVFETLGQEAADGAAVADSVCAQTFCRLELQHRTHNALQDLLHQFPHRLGWQTEGRVEVRENPDGSVSAVVYLARDGYSLPTSNN